MYCHGHLKTDWSYLNTLEDCLLVSSWKKQRRTCLIWERLQEFLTVAQSRPRLGLWRILHPSPYDHPSLPCNPTIPSFPCIWPSVLPTVPYHAYDHPYHALPEVEASKGFSTIAPVSALSYIDHVADYMHTNQRLQDVPSPRQFPTEVPMYLPIKGWPAAKLGIKSVRTKVHFKTTSKRQTHHSDWNNFSIAGPTSFF